MSFNQTWQAQVIVNQLSQLHWLPVYDRIKLKIAAMTHKAIYTGNPPYLANLVQWHTACRTLIR